jgi:predicted nucleic acid-binding protein
MASLVDSSVWVALFLDFDTQHAKAERLFAKFKGAIYLPYCVLNEVATVLAYKHSKEQADQFLNFIEQNSSITVLQDNATEEISFYKSLKAKISFTDATLLLFSKQAKTKLITFDKQLEHLSNRF